MTEIGKVKEVLNDYGGLKRESGFVLTTRNRKPTLYTTRWVIVPELRDSFKKNKIEVEVIATRSIMDMRTDILQ